MSYYKKGKTTLIDTTHSAILKTILEEVEKYPEDEQKKKAKVALKLLEQKFPDIITAIKDGMIQDSAKRVRKTLRLNYKDEKGFKKRFRKNHLELINNYHTLLGVGIDAVDNHRKLNHELIGEKETVLPFLLRLHARAHRIANEVLELTQAGYGTGALARWKAMHETVVSMAFVREYGYPAIQAMKDHEAVSKYKRLLDYQKYCEQLGQKPLSPKEVRSAKAKYDRRIKKYDNIFKGQYGWAAYITNGAVNNFKDLEAHVGKDHLRPYYRHSSLAVHLEYSSLLIGEEFHALQGPDGVALIGSADYGFEDAVSLSLLTVAHADVLILTYNTSMESLIYATTILELEQKAQDSIGDAKWVQDL